nr:TetR/AcrR family transcriptional regulator C-terminal domain-containing protein [Flexivirga caeni]
MPAIGDAAGLDGVACVCRDLRQVLMTHPGAARVMASGPSRMKNERAFTERLLGLLVEAGLSDNDTIYGYHALVEFTVGSAAIDSIGPARSAEEEAARHRRWRADYLAASSESFPETVRLANELYPDASEQFRFGLDLLIEGLRRRVGSQP